MVDSSTMALWIAVSTTKSPIALPVAVVSVLKDLAALLTTKSPIALPVAAVVSFLKDLAALLTTKSPIALPAAAVVSFLKDLAALLTTKSPIALLAAAVVSVLKDLAALLLLEVTAIGNKSPHTFLAICSLLSTTTVFSLPSMTIVVLTSTIGKSLQV
jgi:hypothetical protein